MLNLRKKKKKRRAKITNIQIVNWAVFAAMALAVSHSMLFSSSGNGSLHSAAEAITAKGLTGFENYKGKVFPDTNVSTSARENVAGNTAPPNKTQPVCAPVNADIDFREIVVRSSGGAPLSCGDTVKIHITVWNVAGKKIFSPADPITFTTGQSDVCSGLDHGVVGMRVGEARTLIIPPALQKTASGKTPVIDIPFPGNETVLVDIEAVP